jgi:hypothetical protein
MERYWAALLDDDSLATEKDMKWSDLDTSRIRRLTIVFDGRAYALPDGQRNYIQAKTASVPIEGGEAVIESRYIGFREAGREYCLRILESNGFCLMEIR